MTTTAERRRLAHVEFSNACRLLEEIQRANVDPAVRYTVDELNKRARQRLWQAQDDCLWSLAGDRSAEEGASERGITLDEYAKLVEAEIAEDARIRRRIQGPELRRRAARRHEEMVREFEERLPTHEAKLVVSGKLEETPALAAVRRFMSGDGDRGGFLVLAGPTGRGKTLAAYDAVAGRMAAAAKRHDYREIEREWLITDPRTLVRHFEAWGNEERLEPITRSHALVVVDDLGGELVNDRVVEALFRLVDGRQADGLKTIITTNLVRGTREVDENGNRTESLLGRYGERTIRRIEHRGVILAVKNEDLRRKAA